MWKKLGLPGETPTVRAFEQESKVVYHEVGGFEPGKQPGEDTAAAPEKGKRGSK
jgi:4-hydroxy-3-polyprenylbenzoate decarboxylase